jgi:hypothetical protein
MRSFTVCIYLVKAAELEVIRMTARNLLRGLKLAAAYTPHFAMCTDNLSEIMITTNTEPDEIRSVMRFSCSGLCPRPEMKAIAARMTAVCGNRLETVRLWYENEPEYFEKAAAKANQSIQKTLKELSRKAGSSFNIMIINNDILPLLELVASKEYNHLETARPGNVIQLRYEVGICERNIMNWQLVHAYNLK